MPQRVWSLRVVRYQYFLICCCGVVRANSPPERHVPYLALSAFSCGLSASLRILVCSFIKDESITANLALFAGICPMFAILFRPVWRHNDIKGIVEHLHFHRTICIRRCRNRRRRVNFNEPGLQIVLDENIVSVNFEAVLVIDHDVLHRLKREVYNLSYAFKTLFCSFFALSLLQIES